jgi:N-acetylmuramoyl-L-alanine amidase
MNPLAWRTTLLLGTACILSSAPARVDAVRFWSFGDVTRIAIQTEGDYRLLSGAVDEPLRVGFDLAGAKQPTPQTIHVGDPRLKEIRIAEVALGLTRILFDLEKPAEVVSSQLVNPDRLMIEIRPRGASLPELAPAPSSSATRRLDPPESTAPSATPPPAAPTPAPVLPRPPPPRMPSPASKDSNGDKSLIRVLGLKVGKVVIDAGHGGHDTGTIGANGLMEKDLVLDVALRLGKLISTRLGAQVVYTRSTDVFIPLEQRTRIANDEKADLFISIHANSSPEPSATGVETYYFNLSSDKRGLDVATRENASAASSIADLNDLLHKAVLQNKLEESREFAQRVQTSLWGMSVKMNSRSRDRGVRHAPFVVLIGATMPSILAEIGFVSNAHDETLMRKTDQRQKIADALFKGVSQYSASLSHTEIARVGK